MRKQFYLNLLTLSAMAVGGILPATATVYEAKEVLMNTGFSWSGEDFYYTLLGENEEGYQIWGWLKNTTSYYYTYWKIDGGYKLSLSSPPIYKVSTVYSISRDYRTKNSREIGRNENQSYFLKVNSQTSADFFYCNPGDDIYSYAKDFYVVASITADVADATFDGSTYSQKVTYIVNGPTIALVKSVVLEASYDDGSTWTNVGSYSALTGTFTATTDQFEEAVLYRFTVYPNDDYRSVVESGCWMYVTDEYDPSGIEEVSVDADKDDTPTDIYDLTGRLVARQIAPSEASNVLSDGIYVAGGKRIVVRK